MNTEKFSEREKFILEKIKLGVLAANGDELLDWYGDLQSNCNTRVKAETLLVIRQELINRGMMRHE